jgi:hypothetical protein
VLRCHLTLVCARCQHFVHHILSIMSDVVRIVPGVYQAHKWYEQASSVICCVLKLLGLSVPYIVIPFGNFGG